MTESGVFLWKNNGKIIQPGFESVAGPDTWITSNWGLFLKEKQKSQDLSAGFHYEEAEVNHISKLIF